MPVSMSVNMGRVPHRGVEVLGIELKSLDFAAGAVPTEQSCQGLFSLSKLIMYGTYYTIR